MSSLERSCRGVVFISETDADFEPFSARIPRSRSLRSYLNALGVKGDLIEEMSFKDFFDHLTTKKEWHGPREKKRREKFARLRSTLEKELDDLRVIRIGTIRIDIYIAGVDTSGRLAGVKTKALET